MNRKSQECSCSYHKHVVSTAIKKEADPEVLLHQFFRKCLYTYCVCLYTNCVRTILSIMLILLYHSLEK
jgi:hypothetical protein